MGKSRVRSPSPYLFSSYRLPSPPTPTTDPPRATRFPVHGVFSQFVKVEECRVLKDPTYRKVYTTMQRLRLTLSNRLWTPHRPLRLGWNRGYAEQPNSWNHQYHQDADPTPRRTLVYVGAGLIATGVYYFSRQKVHAESPANTKTRRMPALFR